MGFGYFDIDFIAIRGILAFLKKNGLDCYLIAKEAVVLGKIKKSYATETNSSRYSVWFGSTSK